MNELAVTTNDIVEAAQQVCSFASLCMRIERRRSELAHELAGLSHESNELFVKLYKAQDELNKLAKAVQS